MEETQRASMCTGVGGASVSPVCTALPAPPWARKPESSLHFIVSEFFPTELNQQLSLSREVSAWELSAGTLITWSF